MIRPGPVSVVVVEMPVTLRAESFEVELAHWYEARRGGTRRISDFTGSLDLVCRLWRDPEARAELRALACSARDATAGPHDDDHVCQWIAERICSGDLFVVTRQRPPVSFHAPQQRPLVDLADDVEPLVPKAQDEPEPNWITFEILDEDGKPAAGVRLRLVGPEGTAQELTTNGRGEVHLPDVPTGAFDLEWIQAEDALEVVSIA